MKESKFIFCTVTIAFFVLALAVAQPSTKLEFWTYYLSPKFDAYLSGVARSFEKSHPGVQVVITDKQDTLERDLAASVILGSAPDVVNLWYNSAFNAAQNGLLAPINEFVSPETLKTTYWENPLGLFEINGKNYGFPWYGWIDQGVLAYNPALLHKAGLSAKQLPKTLDGLLEVSRRIKQKTGAYGWLPSVKDPEGISFFGRFRSEGLKTTENKRAVFNSPAHVAVLQKYVTAMREDTIPQELLRKEAFQLTMELYSQGKAAFIVGGPQALVRVRDANPAMYAQTRIVEAPLGASNRMTGSCMALTLPAAGKNKVLAAEFAAFMTNNANQVKFALEVPVVPTTKAAENDPTLLRIEGPLTDPIVIATKRVSRLGRYIHPGTNPNNPVPDNLEDMVKNFSDNIEAAFLEAKTAQQALADAADFWNANAKY